MTKAILISEIFGPVVQGEGSVIGRQTIFVRTFACDSRCKLCDTMYAVDPYWPGAETRTLMTPIEILEYVNELDPSRSIPVTLSGGNPALWDLNFLVDLLHTSSREVWIETQGTHWETWIQNCDLVTISPKGPGMNDEKLGVLPLQKLDIFVRNCYKTELVFKVVIFGESDLDYAEIIHKAYPSIPLYLSVGSPVGNYAKNVLTVRLRQVMEQTLARPALRRAIVLPQLHALAYGGQRGV